MIKIGIESTFDKLRSDIMSHPGKYFFILVADGQAALCIRTCNSQGEDLRAHIVDGLVPDLEGDLISVFEDGIKAAILEQRSLETRHDEDEEYVLTGALEKEISNMPGLIDWIMSSVLNNDRHILINAFWVAQ